jgi:predicted NBD/HSP70 family sugar kinase/biotin operon repressor
MGERIVPVMGKEELGSLGSLRESNRERVVQALQALGVASRAEIARRTGLSRSTVSSIVADLQEVGLVSDHAGDGRVATGGGRPPSLIALDPSAGLAVGIDLGKQHLSVAVADLSHAVVAERRRDLPDDYDVEQAMDGAAELVDVVLSESGAARDRVLGVGMGVPGPIHSAGTVGSAAILPGWGDLQVAERMSERLGFPVRVENDANLGALAEYMWGAGDGCDCMVYLKCSAGIGAGFVLDGRIYKGAGGTAGEIGHTTVDETGDICRCGNRGCLETYAGATAIARLLTRSLGQPIDPDTAVERAVSGDPLARRAFVDAGRHIGVVMADICNLLNPERIVVGGGMGNAAADLLLDPLREAVQLRAIASAADDVEVVPSRLGDRAELLGAVALVLREARPAHAGRGRASNP